MKRMSADTVRMRYAVEEIKVLLQQQREYIDKELVFVEKMLLAEVNKGGG